MYAEIICKVKYLPLSFYNNEFKHSLSFLWHAWSKNKFLESLLDSKECILLEIKSVLSTS